MVVIGAVSILRALSIRINAVSPTELPGVIAIAATDLIQCRDLLRQSHSLKQKDGEAGIVIHRFNTQISALLSGRTTEERWAAAVLIKACIEAGGWEVLNKSAHWLTGLVTNLKKSDPPSTRILTITTITRLFMLTWDHPSLVREVTTPNLPGFVTICLGLCRASTCPSVLTAILHSFNVLLPRHPTIFRTSLDTIRALLVNLTQSAAPLPRSTFEIAARLSVQLHQCEPRQGAAQSWERGLSSLVEETHVTLDHLLSGVNEQWSSTSHKMNSVSTNGSIDNRTERIYEHYKTTIRNLSLLQAYILVHTPAAIQCRLGMLFTLITRLSATAGSLHANMVTFRADVSRDEQHALLSNLPGLHVAMYNILESLLRRYGQALLPIIPTLLDQACWIFKAEHANTQLRGMVYRATAQLLKLGGPAMAKVSVASMSLIIKSCCDDLMTTAGHGYESQGTQKSNTVLQINADTMSKKKDTASHDKTSAHKTSAQRSAHQLLPVLLETLSSDALSDARRTDIDRTAILTRHMYSMLASVMNPPALRGGVKAIPSLLPLLAREYPAAPEVEALIRPRMPIIQTRSVGDANVQGDGQTSDDEAQSEADIAQNEDSANVEHGGEIYSDQHEATQNDTRKRSADGVVADDEAASKRHRGLIAETMQSSTLTRQEADMPVAQTDYSRVPDVDASIVAEADSRTQAAQHPESDDDDFVIPDLDLRSESGDEDE